MIENLDYILFSGTKSDIYLDCGLKIKQRSISEINDMKNGNIGYKRYEQIIWNLTRYPYEFKFDLEDFGVNYNKLTTYDIFVMLIQNRNINDVLADLNYLFDDNFLVVDGYFRSINGVINEESIEEIKNILNRYMFFKKPKERKPANKEAKDMIKMQIKRNRNKIVEYDVYSIMYSLVNSQNSKETYDTLLLRTPHQIYASYISIQQQKDFDNTMSGIYAGVIKSADINYNKINWINKLNKEE